MSKSDLELLAFNEKQKDDVELTTKIIFIPKHISARDADITLKFMEMYDTETSEITPAEEKSYQEKSYLLSCF